MVMPEDDSGFLMVGAAEMVAEDAIWGGVAAALCVLLPGALLSGAGLDEYAGNVGFIGGAAVGIGGCAKGFCCGGYNFGNTVKYQKTFQQFHLCYSNTVCLPP